MRIFSNIKTQSGPDEDGTTIQKRVPIIYGDPSWMAAQILKGGSENTMIPSPIMAAWIYNLEMDKDRRHNPTHESSKSGIERNWNPGTQTYGTEKGNRFTIDRYMPVPYKLTMQLDMWTTLTTTKLQILEQILALFNPSIQIQVTANMYDWTSHLEVEMTNVTWSNRSIPNGTEMERDVASLQFDLGIWINPPAKVKTMKLIEQVVTNVHAVDSLSDTDINGIIDNPLDSLYGKQDKQFIVTPGNFKVKIGIDGFKSNEVVLLNKYGSFDEKLRWDNVFSVYGNLNLHSTLLRLKLDENIDLSENDIIGEVTWDESRPYVLIYNIDEDTLPLTTLNPVLAIIDPLTVYPGNGLPDELAGQRYLIASNSAGQFDLAVGEENIWGVDAYNNDIIVYDGNNWVVDFNSHEVTDKQIITNVTDNNSYTWDGQEWNYTYLGEYAPGYWRLQNMELAYDPSDEDGSGSINPIIDDPECSPKSPRTS